MGEWHETGSKRIYKSPYPFCIIFKEISHFTSFYDTMILYTIYFSHFCKTCGTFDVEQDCQKVGPFSFPWTHCVHSTDHMCPRSLEIVLLLLSSATVDITFRLPNAHWCSGLSNFSTFISCKVLQKVYISQMFRACISIDFKPFGKLLTRSCSCCCLCFLVLIKVQTIMVFKVHIRRTTGGLQSKISNQ